jgi:triosephosphate isomerase
MKKKKIVIGNWKMNPNTLREAKALNDGIKKKMAIIKKTTVVLCPPTIFLSTLKGKSSSKKLFYGAQSVGKEKIGAFTGETAVSMLKDSGGTYSLVGHSERRAMGETDEDVSKKVGLLIAEKIQPVLCVGEKEIDDHAGHLSFIKNQLVKGLSLVSPAQITQVIIAYEPVFAIGAKEPITPHIIYQRNIFIKKVLAELYGKNKAFDVPILYGGSVTFENAKMLVEGGEVDGLLVGRDSLKANNFIELVKQIDSL